MREEAALELALSGNGQGFDFLRETVLTHPGSLQRIKQWAIDYFYLAPGQDAKEQIARQLENQKRQRTSS